MLVLVCGLISACAQRAAPVVQRQLIPQSFSATGVLPLPMQWWTSLQDEELNELMRLALRNNFSIQQAWDRLDQARALARRSGADAGLQVTGELGASKTRQATAGTAQSSTSVSAGLSASYEIDLWGSIKASSDAVLLDAQARAEDLSAAAISVSADIALTWYRLAAQIEQIALLNEQAATQENIISVIEAQFRHGRARAADVFRQQQLIANTRGRIQQAEVSAQLYRHQLAVLAGLPPRATLPHTEPQLREVGALPSTGLPIEILGRRPDVQSAWLAVLAADKRVSVAQADRYPRLNIRADVSAEAERVDDIFDNWLLRLLGNLVQPLFDGGSRKAEVQRVEAVLQERVHAYSQQVLEALREVEDALVREERQLQYMDLLRQQITANALVLDSTSDLYLKGQSDYIRVLEAVTSQLNLQQQLIDGRRDRVEIRIALCRSLAGSWEWTRGERNQADAADLRVESEP